MCAYYENAEKYTFFSDSGSPFSLDFSSSFLLNGTQFNSVYQYILYQQAHAALDDILAAQILKTEDPHELKVLESMISVTDKDKWIEEYKKAVYLGNEAKFTQNKDLFEELLKTKGSALVYASSTEELWGVGLDPDDPLIQDKGNWEGLNWLGEILTGLREDLIKREMIQTA